MRGWSDYAALARELLGDDPVRVVDALKAAIHAGAAPTDLSRSLAYAAALRVVEKGYRALKLDPFGGGSYELAPEERRV